MGGTAGLARRSPPMTRAVRPVPTATFTLAPRLVTVSSAPPLTYSDVLTPAVSTTDAALLNYGSMLIPPVLPLEGPYLSAESDGNNQTRSDASAWQPPPDLLQPNPVPRKAETREPAAASLSALPEGAPSPAAATDRKADTGSPAAPADGRDQKDLDKAGADGQAEGGKPEEANDDASKAVRPQVAKGKKEAAAAAKTKKASAKTDAGEAPVELAVSPAIDADRPSIVRAPVRQFAKGETFRPSEPPAYRVEPRAGGKPEPPSPERARALALFREAIAQTGRLHASFLAAAQQATASVQGTEGSLASLAQADLDRGLTTLRAGLERALLELGRSADAADSLIEQRRLRTYLAITKTANSAFGTLNALKDSADQTFKGHDSERTAKGEEADKERGGVTGAGDAAAGKVRGLDASKDKDYPTSVKPMPSAVNEAIAIRMPKRSADRSQTYTEERNAQDTHLSNVFTQMKAALEKQFKAISKAMDKTAKNSAVSITRSRNAARSQLAKGARQMHKSVAQARARGQATLIGQHNMLRRQMIVSHRDRALRENTLAQQRAARGAGAAIEAAKAQQAGADSLGEALGKEASRPPDDLAKVMAGSASGMLRQLDKAGQQQRDRLARGLAPGEDDARAQSRVLGNRLDGTAGEAAGQLEAASRSSSDSLNEQARSGTEPFKEIPEQIRAAFNAAYPATKAGYTAQNEGTVEQPGAGQLIASANKTIEDTIAGTGGGTGGGKVEGNAPAAGDAKGKGPKEKPGEFRKRAQGIAEQPTSDTGIKALIATANADIPPRVENKVGPLYDSLMAFSTNVESVLVHLRGLTKQQGRALSDVYKRERGGRNLAADLRSELWKTFSADYTNEQNISAALNYLAGNTVAAANAELKAAVYLWNDTGRSEKVLRALTPEHLDKLKQEHGDTVADVSGDLDESEKKIFDALKEIKPLENLQGKALEDQRAANYKLLGVANAHALKRDIDQAMKTKGEAGGDKAADTVSTAYQSAGSDTLSGGDGAYEDQEAAEARRAAIWKETNSSFEKAAPTLPDGSPNVEAKEGPKLGAIARYAAAARTYTVFVPDDGPNGGHYETVKKGLDPKQARLIDDIANTGPNSEDTAASTIEFETSRKEGKPREDRLRKALLGEDLMGAREGESDEDRAKRLRERIDPKDKLIGDEARVKARKENVLKKVAERRAEGQRTADGKPVPPQSPEQVQKQIVGQLDARFAGDPTGAAYTKSVIESATFEPDPEKAFDFALAHDERNKETLKATTERMNRDQIKEKVAKWDAGKPENDRLYARLGLYGHKGKLEGDARNETEISFRGKPRNDKEKALIAVMVVEQQRRDSAATGRALARGDYDRMVGQQSTVLKHLGVNREDIDEQGDIKAKGPDGKPIKGKFNDKGQLELNPEERAEFETAMRFSHMNAESYKQAVDRISQGIVMALVVAAAIITTFVTFGGAAAIWGPILITAAAGFAGMAMTALIRGDRYTSAEIQRDFVMTLVQAATAGLGAWLGGAARGAGAAAKGAAALEKGAETAAKAAATGEKLAAGAAGLASKEMTFGAKALQFGKDVVVGGATNSLNSFAAGAMDPENRRQGKALDKGIDGGIKGFLSGSLGAALTKPASALARPLGKAGERVAGNVAGGFTTRLAEARIGQAMGDPHQSWAESIESAKEGIAQDIVQGFGEHAAEGVAARRAASKARARAARGEGPETGPPAQPPGEQPTPPVARAPDEDGAARAAAVQEATPPEVRPIAEAAAGQAPKVTDERAGATLARGAGPGDETAVTLRGVPREEEPSPRSRATTAGDIDEFRSNIPRSERDTIPEMEAVKPIIVDDDKKVTFAQHASSDAGAPPGHRIVDSVNLTPEMLKAVHSLPENSVIRATDPKDPVAAERNYRLMREADPNREVLLAFHPETGEYAVVQGGMGSVKKPGSDWIAERHTHPRTYLENEQAAILHALPSGEPGDFYQLIKEARAIAASPDRDGVAVRVSKIDVAQPDGSLTETTFSIILQGDKMELFVTFRHPTAGERRIGPFNDIGHYAEGVLALTGKDITKPSPKPPPEGSYTTASQARRSPPVTADDVSAARFIADRMGAAAEAMGPVRNSGAEGQTPVRPLSAAVEEAHAAVRRMGLVGEPDSLARLTALLNVDDPDFTPAMRAAVASATLDATRAELIRTGQLTPGDDVMMLFRGIKQERLADYEREGIDLSKLGSGMHEDAGTGLYGSQDFESARRYTGLEGSGGQVLPLIVRRSELGNAIDVRTGTPLGDRWLQFLRASKGKGRVWPQHGHLRGQLHPGVDVPIALERDFRGTRFEDFLKSVADDPTLPDSVRAAARDPHITLMDLGGVASTGNDRGILTDQWAMHNQHIADKFNVAHGFPVPGREGPGSVRAPVDDGGDEMRSNIQPRKPPPPSPGSAADPAEIAAMARTGPDVDEINRMQAALKNPDPRGARPAVDEIRAGGADADKAQAHLNALYDTPRGAEVVNISDARILRLSRGLKPGKEHYVTIEGMRFRLHRAQKTAQNPNPPVLYDAEVPVPLPGRRPRVYQFGDGELRVWRTPATEDEPAGRIIQSSLVGKGQERKELEENMFSQGESYERTASTPLGPQAAGYHGPALERGHLHGAGLGVESPFGIGLVPREVNQTLQNRGIERWMRRLRDALPPGAELIYSTDVSWHQTSNRHSRIGYKLDVIIQGKRVPFAEFAIHIEADPPGTPAPQRRGTTGIFVSPLEFRHSEYPHVEAYFRTVRELVDTPEVLHSGLPRAAPDREQIGRDLHQLEPETIKSIARVAEPWELESHNPPRAAAFKVTQWEKGLVRILSRQERPRYIVVDLRGLGLKPLQKEQIGRALARLSERDRQRILLLDDKSTYSSKMPAIFRYLLLARDEEDDS